MSKFAKTVFVAALLAAAQSVMTVTKAEAAPQVARPPQYVMLAFDGSSSIGMWKATRQFAYNSKQQHAPSNFTYFISGVYYVEKALKSKYIEPTHGAGSSAIGWGGDGADLLARYDQTNLAHQEGNEIASHANAHFDGSRWSLAQWTSEFTQFNKIIFDFFNFNGLRPTALFPNGWLFSQKQLVGFRAPLLGVGPGLWETLKSFGYRYDTSKTSQPNYWPQRDAKGFWNFPLASLVIAGTGKRTLSMDFNFYMADSKALPDPANKQRYKRQMVETYLQYFQNNYNGNRAPVHIGHHFSTWNDGAYWEAMQEFALKVCGMAEVKCVTYTELADFMDARTPEEIRAYQTGNFPKMVPVRIADASMAPLDVDVRLASVAPGVGLNTSDRNAYALEVRGADVKAGDRLEISANGRRIGRNGVGFIDADTIRRRFRGENVTVSARLLRNGVEVASATHDLRNVGAEEEALTSESLESRALLGDLPEAHLDELTDEQL